MGWETLKNDDVVVIPAHNEEASIGIVVRYLLGHGFQGDRLLVVDSGCTDDTVHTALQATRVFPSGKAVRVVNPAQLFAPYRHPPGECGVNGCEGKISPSGKGAAMYAAVLALALEKHPAGARIFFIDGDITNPDSVDPIGHLLAAWERKPQASIAKLASAGRENEGMLAFVNTLPRPYNQVSNLAWPLCGQQSMLLADLLEIPFPADYSVEVALLFAMVERYGGDCFVQEPITVHLVEGKYADDRLRYVVRMFTRIMFFMRSVIERGPLTAMGPTDVCAWNGGEWREMHDIGVPLVSPNGGVRETLIVDALLPSVKDLLLRKR